MAFLTGASSKSSSRAATLAFGSVTTLATAGFFSTFSTAFGFAVALVADLAGAWGATGTAVTFDADFIESLTDFVACFFAAGVLDFAADFVTGLATALTGFALAVFVTADFAPEVLALAVLTLAVFAAVVFTRSCFVLAGLAACFFSIVALLVNIFFAITGFFSTLTTFLG